VPRSEYIRPPGPFSPIEQIERTKFQFRTDQRRALSQLLPGKLRDLNLPPDAPPTASENVKTIADWIIQATEEAINSHLTSQRLEGGMNPSNVRAAIRRLREALKPFVCGWVDDETASIVPVKLDEKLATRDREIAGLRLPPMRQRSLAMLCQIIAGLVRAWASANNETIEEEPVLRYIDAALNFADIKHPNIAKHRDRLTRLVYPKENPPQLTG
jgi:hypothetical protein